MSDNQTNIEKAVGSTIGGGTVKAENIAGRDINIHNYGEQRPIYEPPPLPPPGELPPPGNLPPYSRMTMGRNEMFTGREGELRRLAEVLLYGMEGSASLVITAQGIGGVGKTQLATEFAYRFGRFFPGSIYWLSFADGAAVPAEIAACGTLMALHPQFADLALAQQTVLVQQAWQDGRMRLLIFDNCEEANLLQEWRPMAGDCRILLTSRRRSWGRTGGTQILPLATLPREKSIDLLQDLSGLGKADRSELGAIAAALGDLPLALHLAGSFLGHYGVTVTPAAYLAQLRETNLLAHASLMGRGVEDNPTQHTLHVAQTFALSHDRLKPDDPVDSLARALLARLAHFAPGEPVAWALLWASLRQPLFDKNGISELDQVDARRRLLDLGLAEEGETAGGLKLHRLLAEFVRLGQSGRLAQPEDEAQAEVEAAVYAEANRLNKAGYPAPLLLWQSHLRHVTDTALARADETAADLGNELGFHLRSIGDYGSAHPYYQRALAIREKALGPDHPDTATSLNNLGYLLRAMGNLVEARPYYEHALAIREKALGPDHPDTASSLNNLGALLRAMGNLAEARPYYQRALAIYEKALGPDHPDTASSLNNLGGLLDSMGDLVEARPYFERALAIREKALGPDHPATASSLNNLGALLDSLGNLVEARPYYERALAIREKALGPDHPATASSLNNLGALLDSLGNLVEARPYYERALAISEKALGPEHPDTALSLNNLAILAYYEEDLAEAARLMRRALAIREQRLGANHPDTQSSRESLSVIESQLGG